MRTNYTHHEHHQKDSPRRAKHLITSSRKKKLVTVHQTQTTQQATKPRAEHHNWKEAQKSTRNFRHPHSCSYHCRSLRTFSYFANSRGRSGSCFSMSRTSATTAGIAIKASTASRLWAERARERKREKKEGGEKKNSERKNEEVDMRSEMTDNSVLYTSLCLYILFCLFVGEHVQKKGKELRKVERYQSDDYLFVEKHKAHIMVINR